MRLKLSFILLIVSVLFDQLKLLDASKSCTSKFVFYNYPRIFSRAFKDSNTIRCQIHRTSLYPSIRSLLEDRLGTLSFMKSTPFHKLVIKRLINTHRSLHRLQQAITKPIKGEGDWTVLSNGSILKQIRKQGEGPKISSLNNNMTIEFEISRMNGQKLISNHDLDISMLEFPLFEANPGMKAALMSMKRLENAIFIINPDMHKLGGNLLGEYLIGKQEWLIFNIELCNFLHSNDSWEGFKPDMNLTWLPPDLSNEMDSQDELELKGDLLLKQIEEKMETDGNSPYWSDINEQMNQKQLQKVNDHFLKKLSRDESKLKRVSRGFSDNLKSKTNIYGYNIGDKLEGRSKNYMWRETPFEIELLFPISDYFLPTEIDCEINGKLFEITIRGNQVFKDELLDYVDLTEKPFWIINRSNGNSGLDQQNKHSNKIQKNDTMLRDTTTDESFEILERSPCISVLLIKKGQPKLWGNIFLKS